MPLPFWVIYFVKKLIFERTLASLVSDAINNMRAKPLSGRKRSIYINIYSIYLVRRSD
jgi:hypothetical protein